MNAHTQYQQAEEAAKRAEQKARLDIARASANERGPDALALFIEREKTDPNAAIAGEMQEGAKTRQRDIEARLASGGMTQDEIARRFQTPTGFMYGPAEAELKASRTPQQEANDARAMIIALGKQRQEAKLLGQELSPAEEAAYQDAVTIYNAAQSRSRGRVGVQRDTEGARQGESLHRGYAQPAIPAVPAQPAAKPSSTPPPPPLSKYPEQWVKGKRYIQMPDGKLYLSKVQ